MGVLACSRYRCDNIMCSTCVPVIGYICNECQEEFKNYLAAQVGMIRDSEGSILKALEEFMETEKGEFNTNAGINIDDFFNGYRN